MAAVCTAVLNRPGHRIGDRGPGMLFPPIMRYHCADALPVANRQPPRAGEMDMSRSPLPPFDSAKFYNVSSFAGRKSEALSPAIRRA